MNLRLLTGVLLMIVLPTCAPAADGLEQCNVSWNSPSDDARGSMPLGNGSIGLNVWVEKNGDLLFYLSTNEAYSENGQLLKLGRVRVRLTPNPFGSVTPVIKGSAFKQELRLRQGEIVITGELAGQTTTARIWVDANRPVVHLEVEGGAPCELRADLELWRTARRTVDANPKNKELGTFYELRGSPEPLVIEPDVVEPARGGQLVWYHRNERSIYPSVLKNQHLESLLEKHADPLLKRTFGACIKGAGLVATDDKTLKSAAPALRHVLNVYVPPAMQTESIEQWNQKLSELVATVDQADLEEARKSHVQWWEAFWNRSWIHASGNKKADVVSSGYTLQRWMMACSGRGSLPTKFNGGIFSVGSDIPDTQGRAIQNPDYRAWGSNFWFQNNRHLYWPLLASGDFDLVEPFFQMYASALPLAKDRTNLYYKHGGACFQETIYFWGTPNNANFGWNNPSVDAQNGFIKRYWSGGIELTMMMLDRYAMTQDDAFAQNTLLPLADAITTFYDEHWKRDAKGKILFSPAQSLETWHSAVNPTPEIAGLRQVLPRLLALPRELTTEPQRARWQKTLADLPAIPVGPGADGKSLILPAETFSGKRNSENTELYALWPYRIYGVGKAELELALNTYSARRSKGTGCWSQDPIDAALLGLTAEAQRDVFANFSASGARFQAFWRPGHDWIPDLDNGGAAMTALQFMLMQCDGRKIHLLPAWPKEWEADFKLHAPMQTIVEGTVRDGKLVELKVTPESRRADVLMPGQ